MSKNCKCELNSTDVLVSEVFVKDVLQKQRDEIDRKRVAMLAGNPDLAANLRPINVLAQEFGQKLLELCPNNMYRNEAIQFLEIVKDLAVRSKV